MSTFNGPDTSLLPPCEDALRMHYMRTNYQAMIWKNADTANPEIPAPEGHGWTFDSSGILTIDWSRSPVLPQQLVDILSVHESRVNSVLTDDDSSAAQEETLSSDDDTEQLESESSDNEY